MNATTIGEIRSRLDRTFTPAELEVIDEGHLHIGHAGEGNGHFRVRVVSTAFADLTPIERHRLVYAALGDLIGHGIHALAIEARSPREKAL